MSDARNVRMSASPANVEYVRRMYDRIIDWYKVAEAKAQLLLTVNGAFVTVAFGLLSGSIAELRRSLDAAGALTWLFLMLAVVALSGSILAASATLLSQHGRHIREDFAQLGINPMTRTPIGRRACGISVILLVCNGRGCRGCSGAWTMILK
jgi:hypothetical protein